MHRIRGSQGAAWSTRFGVRRAGELLGLGAVSPNQREQNNELGAGAWVGLWDVERNKLMRRFEIPEVWVDGTAYSADGRLLAMASSFPLAVRLVDTDTNELITNMMTTTRSLACAVALSPFGDIVAIGSPDRRVRIWRLQHDGKRWP